MKLWGYYAFHTFINSIKKMFRSTFIIVVASILSIGLIFGVVGGIIGSAFGDEIESIESSEEQREGYGDPEYGSYNEDGEFVFYEDEFTEEDMEMLLLVVEAVAAVVVFALLGFGARSGMKKGSDIFVMADVNFLFTAPMKPQSVLLFRLTFQMLAVVAGSIYYLFQIPNLVLNANIPLEACLLIFLALIITFIYQKLFSLGMYTITATNNSIKKLVLPVLLAIALIIVGIVGIVYFSTDMDVWHTLELTLASGWTRLLPIIGWIKGLVFYAINGNIPMILLYVLLNIVGMVVLVYLIWHIRADFYEDAMIGAQARADLVVAASENRRVVETNKDGKAKKDKRKVRESQGKLFEKSQGALMFFAKEMFIRNRMAKFGIVTNTMLVYLVIGAGTSLLLSRLVGINDFSIIGSIFMLILFFRNYGNPIVQETSMNWLFLVPESPYKKVLFAMLSGTYATAIDLIPGLIVSMIIMKLNPLVLLLWFVTMLTMDFMLSGLGMLLEALFPATAMEMVKASIQLILKFAVIIVIVLAIVIGAVLGGIELGLFINLIVNLLIGAAAFVIYPSMLHRGI